MAESWIRQVARLPPIAIDSEGRIAATGESADAARRRNPGAGCQNPVISPGLIDIHVFQGARPKAKETIGTGSKAAAQGGLTTVVCMPNTTPAIDNPGTVALIQDKVETLVHVHTTGAITRDISGESLASIGSSRSRSGRHHR